VDVCLSAFAVAQGGRDRQLYKPLCGDFSALVALKFVYPSHRNTVEKPKTFTETAPFLLKGYQIYSMLSRLSCIVNGFGVWYNNTSLEQFNFSLSENKAENRRHQAVF